MSNRIDWKNHLIGFIATIFGIIIGLTLDEVRSESETQRRLKDFKRLIDSEIQKNIATLDTLLENSYNYELGLRFLVNKNIEGNTINCTQAELDSVNKIYTSYPFIFNYDKITENKFRIYYALNAFDFTYQNTVWESFKNTDLINYMEPNEITKLTSIYLNLVKKSKDINDLKEQIVHLLDNRRTDKLLSSLTIKDYLLKLIDRTTLQNHLVDDFLINLKSEMGSQHKSKFPPLNLKELRDGFR